MSPDHDTDRGDDLAPYRLALRSADPVEPRAHALAELYPDAVRDGKIDLDALAALLGDLPDEGPERFGLSWPGKAAAVRLAQRPSAGTLVPVKGDSVEWDSTKNIFIEGENLEVLKLLQRSYHGKVKLIYIDPPYNTGKDFVYPDNYRDPLGEYLRFSGQTTENGGRLRANAETSGRYHSSWLSMMWPRLHLARSLLTDDGVFIVSIDDNEAPRLRAILDEIFGEENFIAQLVWDKTRKNDAKFFSVGHEYLIVYARSVSVLRRRNTEWRRSHPGAEALWQEYERLRNKHGADDRAIEASLRSFFSGLAPDAPAKKLSRYKQVDGRGPWRDRDISWPGGGGPRYDVLHPRTGRPCAVPDAGWRFSKPEEMQRQIALGLVVFREDDRQPPFRKAHLRAVDQDDDEPGLGRQVLGSYIHAQSQVAVKRLRGLFAGENVFDNPKDPSVLGMLIDYVTGDDREAIIVDFFAGSGALGEAVVDLNVERGTRHRYMLVQLAEQVDQSPYDTIAEITRERMRRVAEGLRNSNPPPLDLGFRAYRLDASSQPPSRLEPGEHEQITFTAERHLNPSRDDDALLVEVLLARGFDLVTPTTWTTAEGLTLASVADGALVASFARAITLAQFEALVALEPAQLILLEEAFGASDEVKVNALQHLKTLNEHRDTPIELLLL